MLEDFSLNAIYYPQTVCLEPQILKRLILLYDRVYFQPIDNKLNPGYGDSIESRFSINDAILQAVFCEINGFRKHINYCAEHIYWESDLRDLMDDYRFLEAKGIVVPLRDKLIESCTDAHPLEDFVKRDLNDSQFMYWCLKNAKKPAEIPRKEGETTKGGGVALRSTYKTNKLFPIICSERLNTALLLAESNNLIPITPYPFFSSLLNNKLKKALLHNREFADHGMSQKQKAKFSMLSWQLATEVVTKGAIEKKSIQELIEYKQKSAYSERLFRSYLYKLEHEINLDPWHPEYASSINNLMKGEVSLELARLRDAKAQIWNDMFHETLKDTLNTTAIGAAIGFFRLNMAVGVTYFELLAYGLSGITSMAIPKLLDAQRSEKSLKKNALFFLLGLE